MSKIVFFSIPAHGHTNPTLKVVEELASQGHQVWYFSYNFLREKIESAGATFISCDDYDIESKLAAKDSARLGKDLAFSTKILVDTTLNLDDMVSRYVAELKPDCIVADSMALWGKAVAMKFNIPFVCSTTTFAFNKHSAKIMKQSLLELIRMFWWVPQITKQIERLKDKGYPINNILDIIGNNDNVHTVVYTSPEFQPYYETFSDKFAFVGPLMRGSVEEFKKTKDKLIYISMGTVNNDMMPFYKTCISAFKDTNYQVVISVGNMVNIKDFGMLPENISVYPQVDQIAVLKKADAFVSHSGMNSVSESLYFGVPLVLVPQTTEQKGVAQRVLEKGAGLVLKKVNKSALRSAVDKLLKGQNYKQNAIRISEEFKSTSGAKGAAQKILEVCNK